MSPLGIVRAVGPVIRTTIRSAGLGVLVLGGVDDGVGVRVCVGVGGVVVGVGGGFTIGISEQLPKILMNCSFGLAGLR